MTPRPAPTLLRRHMLGALGSSAAAILVGCGDQGTDDTSSSTTTTTDATTTGDTPTSSTTTGDETGTECGIAADAWATGGTAAMTAQACYPDPFAADVNACTLLCMTTAGPCTADTPDRQDVSEGFGGLPVRLALLVVDADTCQPVADARVEIWHTQRTGVYSGGTPNPQTCHGPDPDAANHRYFRGTQTSGADGRVDFDTCFPGWYGGRALHIHFRVLLGNNTHVTSQLFFDDAITEEIFASHPEYIEFGQPDTHNDDDNVIDGEADITPYILDIARMPDGAMLASKVLTIRSSLGDAACILGAP